MSVRSDMRAKKLILSFMLLPIIVPHVITAIAMYFVTARFGLIGNVLWIGFCHAVVALPVVLLGVLAWGAATGLVLWPAPHGEAFRETPLPGNRARLLRLRCHPLDAPGVFADRLRALNLPGVA